MRYFVIIGLMLAGTTLFGNLVSGVSDTECVNCANGAGKPTLLSNAVNADSGSSEVAETIFFTESGIPVRLLTADANTKSLIPVDYQGIFNSLGQEVIPGDQLVVSVFDKRPPARAPRKPILSIGKPAAEPVIAKTTAASSNAKSPSNYEGSRAAAPSLYSTTDQDLAAENNSAISSENISSGASENEESLASNADQENAEKAVKDAILVEQSATATLAKTDESETSNAKMSRLKLLSAFAVPVAITYAALNQSKRNDSEKSKSNGITVSKAALPVTTFAADTVEDGDDGRDEEATPTDDTGVSTTDLLLSGQIDDVEDDVKDLTDTVDELSTDVSGVQTDLTTLEGQVSTVQTQLGDTDVGALASQLNDLESKTYAGIASAASLVTAIPSDPGKTILNVGSGYYEGETAIGVSLSRRLKKVNGYFYSGVAAGISEVKSPLVRVGVGIEF